MNNTKKETNKICELKICQLRRERPLLRTPVITSIIVLLAGIGKYCSAQDQTSRQIPVTGQCTKESHTAEGIIGDDLTKHQTRFYCDTVIVTFLDHYNKHIRVQFFDSKSRRRELGFAGVMEDDGQIMDVVLIYLQPLNSTPATEGACQFVFEKPSMLETLHLKSLFCGAKIDKAGRRSVQIIAFEANPGQ